MNTIDLYLGLEHVVTVEFGSDPLEDLRVADVGALDVAVDGHAVVVDQLLPQDHAPVHLTIVTRNRSDFFSIGSFPGLLNSAYTLLA